MDTKDDGKTESFLLTLVSQAQYLEASTKVQLFAPCDSSS